MLTALADGDFLKWDAALKRWINTTIAVGAHALGDHTDVANSVSIAPINDQIILYNSSSSEWENVTITTNNNTGFTGTPFSHNHDSRYWTQSALAANTGSILNWNNLFNVPSFTPADAEYVVLTLSGDLTNERRLAAGTGISIVDSGANADVTLSVDDNTTQQKINVLKDGSSVGIRSTLNFVEPASGNVTYTITEDALNDRIDVEIDLGASITLDLDDLGDVDVPAPSDRDWETGST